MTFTQNKRKGVTWIIVRSLQIVIVFEFFVLFGAFIHWIAKEALGGKELMIFIILVGLVITVNNIVRMVNEHLNEQTHSQRKPV